MLYKILYLTPSANLLGARRSLLILLENLDKEKYFPIVLCPKKDGELIKALEEKGIRTEILRLRNWRKIRNIRFIPSLIYSLVKLIKKEKINLIHCNEFWVNPYGVISAKITCIPCITHIRTSLDIKKIKNYLLAYSDKLITVSNETRKPIEKFPKIFAKTTTVYNGVDIKDFNPNIKGDYVKKELNIAPEEIVIGTIGQLYPDKGQKTFIQAASIVLKTYPATKFFIVGEAKKERYKTQLQDLVDKLGIKDKVIFTDNRNDIPQILASIDIFALPTLKEGFARVIIEAMACAKPVIATRVGGNSEAVVDKMSGFLIPVNSPDVLAQKIIELIQDEDKRKSMGSIGRERVVNNFSLEHYVKKIEKIYEEFLK
ncbi:MAG: glycosyltransferase [Candidatus Omnitrophica bacterium]|nr:glycosyltransferase [Candidatus Omnitrophota bacterium]MBU1047353.1 glycosyltransferase [Candidatus Omnitrophota bacterium]MBU1766617.1 glycosyltransferase [Candidatus Omnitrophota bacterium]MBU1889062.1 glycosyltransferase [Candidatus Omnitrophota bacterium]